MSYEKKFRNRQELLVLESNSLLSSQHILASDATNLVWKDLQNLNNHFNLFAMIERSSKHTVMAFYTTDYKTLKLPLREGSIFSNENSKEVIVGDDILTTNRNGIDYYNYNSIDYRVIGTFGVSKNSPLKKYILINDSDLIHQTAAPLIFDGKHIDKIQWLEGTVMENKGIERWFNIEFILTLVSITIWIVIICATILAAYSLLIAREEIRVIQFQIGIKVEQILKQDIILINYLILTLIVSSWLLITKNINVSATEIILSYLVIYIVLIGAYTKLFFSQIFKETMYV